MLITLDTTRADRLGNYGYARAVTPNLDALAAHGAAFDQAFSPCPLTLPAHATILTGLEPPQHGLRINGRSALAAGVPTLAALLADRGYATGAFVAAYVVNHRFGLDRGFAVYDDDLRDKLPQEVPEPLSASRSGDRVVDRAIAWLSTVAEGPFLAWVHLYDPHYPYQRHPELSTTRLGDAASYDGDIAFMDLQVGRLLRWLDQHRLREQTLVVAVGDHGEGLEEHGEVEHGYLLNVEALHVPLIVSRPGTIEEGRRIGEIVSLVDLLPTVLDHLRIATATGGPGRSLAPALRGATLAPVTSYAETELPFAQFGWSPMRSLITDRWHFVRSARPELYERAADPAEHVNLAPGREAEVGELDAELAARDRMLGRDAVEPARVALDAAARRRLEALGYVSGGSGHAEASSSLRDMKDMLPVKHLATILRRRMARGEIASVEVERTLRELVARSPETASFQSHLGSLLVTEGRLDEARPVLEIALRLDPDLPEALVAMANFHARQGARNVARELFQRALAREPDLPEARLGLGNMRAADNDLDGARAAYESVLRLEPELAEAHERLGNVLVQQNELAGAGAHYERALALRPGLTAARFNLGRVREKEGHPEEAARLYREVLNREPGSVEASNALALFQLGRGELDPARRELVAALRRHRDSAQTHHNLATVLARQHRVPKALVHEARAVALGPDEPEHLNGLAWLLATTASQRRRDPPRAIALAERACALTAQQDARLLNTLAAAYASANRPADAARTAHEASRVARVAGQGTLAAETERLARLYEQAARQ